MENEVPQKDTSRHMNATLKPGQEFFVENEAAELLGISRDRLHWLLDQNVFNDGAGKPSDLHFRVADLVMIEFWDRRTPIAKIMRMPKKVSA